MTNLKNPALRKTSRRGRLPDGAPNPIDVHVGKRIRMRRIILRLTQEQLAEKIGLTFQHVQKYERGMNRISASRLWDIATVMDVPVGFFFADMDKTTACQSPRAFSSLVNSSELDMSFLSETDPMARQETLELISAYYKIPDRSVAKKLFNLTSMMSKSFVPKKSKENDGRKS